MKKLLLLSGLLLLVGVLQAQEEILRYDTDITIEESGDVIVQETITVRAEGKKIKRGIFRNFPTNYKDKLGNNYNVGFEVLGVLRNGEPEPYHTEEKDNGIYVYFGSSSRYLEKGEHTYVLTFRTDRQVGFFDTYDELYFNAIGGGWAFPILASTVVVHVPGGENSLQYAAYTGRSGSTGCSCEIKELLGAVEFRLTEPLGSREQFTVAVGWKKGLVHEPTIMEKGTLLLRDNFNIILALIGLLVSFLYLYKSWEKVGRDPESGTIIPQYQPPDDFSPAMVNYVSEMGFTEEAFTASIVNLAVKGYLTIENDAGNFKLIKKEGSKEHLSSGENAVFLILLKNRRSIMLDNLFHKEFSDAQSALHQHLAKGTQPTHFRVNSGRVVTGGIIGAVFLVISAIFSGSPLVPILMAIALVAMVITFFYLMKAPSQKGRKALDDIEGFKLYLTVAEKNQMDAAHEPDMTTAIFEKYLPYAIALGVENAWARKFESRVSKALQEAYKPRWYGGTYVYGGFHATTFSASLSNSFSSAISSAATPPGSSSGSGGSFGGGGGGFSGGGGGGGGGGGW